MDAIYTRRSIRRFQEKAVEHEKILQVLKAGMQAPSAVNQQPWEFIVINDREIKEKLSQVSPYSKMVAQAPLVLVLAGNEDRMKFKHHWEQDMSAATENILLEAVGLGLGSVWIGVAPAEDRMKVITDILKLKNTYKPFCMIAMGYPGEGQENKFVDRFDETRIHYDFYKPE